MANEIQINIQAFLKNLLLTDSFAPGNIQINQTTQLADGRVIAVATADTAYTFADIVTYGWMMLYNMDPTNFVIHGPTSAGAIVNYGKMKAKEPAILRLYPGITLRMKADTAICNVLAKIWND